MFCVVCIDWPEWEVRWRHLTEAMTIVARLELAGMRSVIRTMPL